MSNLVSMLEQLAVMPQKEELTSEQLNHLCEQFQLDPALTHAMLNQDLAKLQEHLMISKGGCFVIVSPEQPDDEPNDDDDSDTDKSKYHC